MQRRHKEKQKLQTHLEKAVEVCHIKQAVQKIRKINKTKVWEKVEKKKLVEKKKRKWLEYLKKLQNEVLTKNAILIASTENFQIVRTKHKEVVNIFLEDKAGLQLFKKVKGKQLKKYCENAIVKIGDNNLYERCVHAR